VLRPSRAHSTEVRGFFPVPALIHRGTHPPIQRDRSWPCFSKVDPRGTWLSFIQTSFGRHRSTLAGSQRRPPMARDETRPGAADFSSGAALWACARILSVLPVSPSAGYRRGARINAMCSHALTEQRGPRTDWYADCVAPVPKVPRSAANEQCDPL